MKILFIQASIILGSSCLALSYLFYFRVHRDGGRSISLPRRPVWIGMCLGIVCLIWSAYYGCQMLEGELEKYRTAVWVLVPVTAVLSFFYLDYINARSFGGLVTLCANFLIKGAFAYDVPGRGAYDIVCLLLGIGGLIGIGIPWKYRDLLQLSAEKKRIRQCVAGILALGGLMLVVMPLFSRLQ